MIKASRNQVEGYLPTWGDFAGVIGSILENEIFRTTSLSRSLYENIQA